MTLIKGPNGLVLDVTPAVASGLIGAGRAAAVEDEAVRPAAPTEPKANASRGKWAAWAEHLGIEVPAGATRDEIREHVAGARAATDDERAKGVTAVITVAPPTN